MNQPILPRNSEAVILSEQGLQASLSGNQDSARQHYGSALDALNFDGSPSAAAQAAGIMRDLGFTYTREAIAKEDCGLFEQARDYLYVAASETTPFVSGVPITGAEQVTPITRPQHGELVAEHMATLTLLARTATAEEVIFSPTDITQAERGLYVTAHSLGYTGLNGYFWASNAVNAARDDYLLNDGSAVATWMKRTTRIISWTSRYDPTNTSAAMRTYIARQAYLQNRKTAVASIYSHP